MKKVSGMDRVFFTNSGAEAIEGALKAARKYAYLKDGRYGSGRIVPAGIPSTAVPSARFP